MNSNSHTANALARDLRHGSWTSQIDDLLARAADEIDRLERELAEAKKRGDAYAEKFNAECNRSDLILRRAMNAEAALSEKAATQQPSAPCVARQTLTSSRWSADGELIWWIEGEEISDSDLRKWCANNMAGPNRYVDVIRECHVRAYSQRERPG